MAKLPFQEVLARRNDLLHRQAVWKEILAHLEKFLSTDTTPAKIGITTTGEGMVVPQPIIESVIAEIDTGPLDQVIEDLRAIDNSEVAENVRKKSETSEKAILQGRKAKGESSSKN